MSNPKVAVVALAVVVAFIIVVLLLPSNKQDVTASIPASAPIAGTKSK